MFCEQLLQMSLDTVFDQPWIDPQFMTGIEFDVVDRDAKFFARLVGDDPFDGLVLGGLDHPTGRRHPVEGLVRPVVRVHTDRSVGLDEQQASSGREMCGEAADVVHLATSNN